MSRAKFRKQFNNLLIIAKCNTLQRIERHLEAVIQVQPRLANGGRSLAKVRVVTLDKFILIGLQLRLKQVTCRRHARLPHRT